MKVVTFGELMVRLQPFNYERFVQANSRLRWRCILCCNFHNRRRYCR